MDHLLITIITNGISFNGFLQNNIILILITFYYYINDQKIKDLFITKNALLDKMLSKKIKNT